MLKHFLAQTFLLWEVWWDTQPLGMRGKRNQELWSGHTHHLLLNLYQLKCHSFCLRADARYCKVLLHYNSKSFPATVHMELSISWCCQIDWNGLSPYILDHSFLLSVGNTGKKKKRKGCCYYFFSFWFDLVWWVWLRIPIMGKGWGHLCKAVVLLTIA